jgi:ATP-dependent Lon protease
VAPLDPLDEKLLAQFPGKVVRKDLVTPLKGEYLVPNYVLEFLLGRYCASTDPEVIAYLPGWELPRMRTEMLTAHHGFIVDYLADLWRLLRGSSFASAIDRHYRLGPAIDRRDDKAIRRTTSGLLKLVHPDGEFGAGEVSWALELALEMRRRVKEQLKRMGGLEYWQTHFTYSPAMNGGPEREVAPAEQATEGLLSPAEIPPGRLFAVGRNRDDRRPCILRIEVELVPGSGRATLLGLRTASASSALHAAYDHLRNRLSEYGVATASLDRDVRVHILNPMEADDPVGLGLGIFLAIASAMRGAPVPSGLAVVGDMSVQGSILAPDAVGEMVLLARESGARGLFVPEETREDITALPDGLTRDLSFGYFSSPSQLVGLALEPKHAGRSAARACESPEARP